MSNTIQQQVEERVQAFVSEVTSLVRSAALEAVSEALGSGRASAGRASAGGIRRRGRPAGSKNRAPRAARGTRGRRSSAQVDAMAARILEHVKKNPGANVEGMARTFNVKSKELTLPIGKLLAEKKLKTTGQRRGTKYHAR